MNFFANITSVEELKKAYKEAAKKHHPDRGGDVEIMKAVNLEYEEAFKMLIKKGRTSEEAADEWEIESIFMEKVQALVSLEGITIELCGKWIWITGNTFPVKEAIKAAGFFFASKKKAWFWRPDEAAGGRGKSSLDEIRAMHGSKKLSTSALYLG